MRVFNLLLGCCVVLVVCFGGPQLRVSAAAPAFNVQKYLDSQPGVLKSHREGKYTAAQLIDSYTQYYNLDPRVPLTLLELEHKLLSDPRPTDQVLRKPFGSAGPEGFKQQTSWAVREIRAGFGPYTDPPVVKFTDGTTTTLDLDQDDVMIAVQRFLAQGRTQSAWRGLVDRYEPLYRQLFGALPEPTPTTPAATRPFLKLPWPAGIEVIHSSYFDHVYPTVDRGSDDNSFIVDYLGRGNLSYNTHDGHDYYFPQQPIGTPILAAAPGMAYAYSTPGNGVVIRHGGAYAGYETVYWHLDQFALLFQGKIDNGVGVPVDAGTVLGVSGKSGFTDGGAHLHFEVRHNGKQVDPYGWYGPGPDPCAAWTAGCEASVWLWHDSLRGTYDFTPPDAPAPKDTEPPQGSLAVSPDAQLGLLARFDGSIVPTLGTGAPQTNRATPRFSEGVFGEGIQLGRQFELTYPISGNLELERGSIALWAKLPAEYPSSSTGRHYLLAASANPEAGDVYTNTLALRRERGDNGAQWNFWTVDADGEAHHLTAPDTFSTDNWHHFAIVWDRTTEHKALFIDGQRVAQTNAATLPTSVGTRLHLGRFIASFGVSGVALDELATFRRVLSEREIERLAARQDIYTAEAGPISTARVVTDTTVVLDANAIDAQGGIVSVQLRRNNEPWREPQSYHDSYRWRITGGAGEHTFAIRYRDRADNETIVTTTLELAAPLLADATVRSRTNTAAVLGFTLGESSLDPRDVELQLSTEQDFAAAVWEPFSEVRVWNWAEGARREVWVRFRDARGRVSAPLLVGPDRGRP
jgi:murein DD-endopeptidase MepM/ murein hydrolase activator NlpD